MVIEVSFSFIIRFNISIFTIVVDKQGVGNAAALRKYFDGQDALGDIIIERAPSMIFTRPGTVKAWKLYSKSRANSTMMVVRQIGYYDELTVVGMNTIVAPNGKEAVIPVPTADRIRFKAGDMIAWYYWLSPNPTIP